MSFQLWVVFATTIFFLSMTPGPNMLLAMTHGIKHGPRRTIATAMGEVIALVALMTISATGLGALLAASETAFAIVKWAGVAYLVWIGIQSWRSREDADNLSLATGPQSRTKLRRLFLQGFVVSFSNPKALAFFVALFPQFLNTSAPLAPQLLILGATFAIIEFVWIMIYASGGHRIAPSLRKAGRQRMVNRLSAGVLIGAAGLLAAVQRG